VKHLAPVLGRPARRPTDRFAAAVPAGTAMRRGTWCEHGFGTVEYLAAVSLSLILLVMVANVVVIEYGRGVLRAAVDEAVRDGSRYFAGEPAAEVESRCEHRAQEVLRNLLRGRMGRGLTPRCT
jgi:hypothetical protein